MIIFFVFAINVISDLAFTIHTAVVQDGESFSRVRYGQSNTSIIVQPIGLALDFTLCSGNDISPIEGVVSWYYTQPLQQVSSAN